MNTIKTIFLSIIVILMLQSCNKEAGEGGTSTIRGHVFVMDYNRTFTTLQESYYGPHEDVYIIYGDDAVYGDRMETSYDGTYEFNYLKEGTYTLFAYSADTTNPETSKEVAVIQIVEITGKNQVVEVPDIVIIK